VPIITAFERAWPDGPSTEGPFLLSAGWAGAENRRLPELGMIIV
jgi:hypothetical protein